MIRNLKALGLALVAVFAMSALAASAAQAETLFHSDATETFITGTQDGSVTSETGSQTFTANSATIHCGKLDLEGVQSGSTAEEVTLTFDYTHCEFLFFDAFVDPGECDYVFHADGTVDIHDHGEGDCEANPITFGVEGLCEAEVGPQTGLGTIAFHHPGSTAENTTDITGEAEVTGISGSSEGPFCTETGAFTDGVYEGNATIQGYKDANHTEQVSIWTTTP